MLDRFNSNTSKPNAVRLLAIVFFATALMFAIIGTVMGDSFYVRLATEALIFGGLALSVDLLLGSTWSAVKAGGLQSKEVRLHWQEPMSYSSNLDWLISPMNWLGTSLTASSVDWKSL